MRFINFLNKNNIILSSYGNTHEYCEDLQVLFLIIKHASY